MKKIVVTDSDLGGIDIERRVLGPEYDVQLLQTLDSSEIVEQAEGALALIVQRAKIGADLLKALPSLRAVIRYGMGVDNIDTDAAADLGIKVSGVKDYCIREVAEHTAMFVSAAGRQLWNFRRSVHEGRWGRGFVPLPRLPEEDPVGIVGFGSIGRAVASRLYTAGHPIVIFDPHVDSNAVEGPYSIAHSLESLAEQVMHLTLHSPLNEQTKRMVSQPVLGLLGPEGHLVNTSRGELVDEEALLQALDSNSLAHASLDVLSVEPPSPAMKRLVHHERTTITPHIAYLSSQSLPSLRHRAAVALRSLLEEDQSSIVSQDLESPGVAS